MTGSISAAFYGAVPPEVDRAVRERLDDRLNGILDLFERRYL